MADRDRRAGRRTSGEVRAVLLEVAAEQFAQRPYGDVTTADIADAAGVAISVMYRHFGSKAELFSEATLAPLSASLGRFAERWRAQRNRPDHWESRRIAEEFMIDLYRSMGEHRDALIALAHVGPELEDQTAQDLEGVINTLLDQILLVGIEESDAGRLWFPREGLDLAIRLLVAMVFGATAFDRWLIPRSIRHGPPEHMVKVLTDLATWGLSSRPPGTNPPHSTS